MERRCGTGEGMDGGGVKQPRWENGRWRRQHEGFCVYISPVSSKAQDGTVAARMGRRRLDIIQVYLAMRTRPRGAPLLIDCRVSLDMLVTYPFWDRKPKRPITAITASSVT